MLRKIIIGIFSIVTLVVILLHALFYMMSYSDTDINQLFPDAEIKYLNSMRTIFQDNKSDTTLIFVHGAPGDFSAFNDYYAAPEFLRYNWITYDRPGYGYSSSSPTVSIIEQSDILLNIINHYRQNTKVVLVGHSYGCAIAGYVSAQKSELITKLIMIAPLIDPESEPIFWYSYFGKWKLTSWMLPNALQSAAYEKFAHSQSLHEINDSWKEISCPVLHIHGGQDALAPPSENLNFSKKEINPNYLTQKYYEDDGHLVIWQELDKIKTDISDFVKE